MAHHSSVVAKPWKETTTTYMVMPSSIGIVPPQYSAPPLPPLPHQQSQQQLNQSIYQHHQYQLSTAANSVYGGLSSNNSSSQHLPSDVHHKSMWAVNPLYASNSGRYHCVLWWNSYLLFCMHNSVVLNESDSAYRTRSLPAWGKFKQRPVSTTDDLEELYAKVSYKLVLYLYSR